MMNKIFYSFICLVIFSCVASPRYSSNPNTKSSSSKKSKTVTNASKSSSNSNRRYSSKSNSKIRNDVITGISSWYGPNFHGKLTANGEVFDQYGVTAAHKTLPLGTVVRVTNLDNDKSIILRINDRGPYVGDRVLDCSYGAAKKLDFMKKGTANVEIRVIELGDGVYMHHNE